MLISRISFAFALVFLLYFWNATSSIADSKKPDIRISKDAEINDEQAKWNSHINNQAYLKMLEERRQEQLRRYSRTNSTMIINRSGRYDCPAGKCDSWGVEYQSGGTTFIYQENYQPVKIYPVIIDPYSRFPRSHTYMNDPYQKKKSN